MPRLSWGARSDWLPYYRMVKGGQVLTYGDDRAWSGDILENEVWVRANAKVH